MLCCLLGAERLDSVFRKKTKKEVLKQLDRKARELHLKVEIIEIPKDHRVNIITDKSKVEEI